ncbi:hypothetical protein COLO4_15210 [Corchorus olitorius]|uniref:Uncharacterized protein n=1 Tax=Corchorus olitorius TaxID=93759 RepID=A0A1R3JP08_9ROSI|nr:hypothetical protein COLO4_15210 [Corchorus olitorius]
MTAATYSHYKPPPTLATPGLPAFSIHPRKPRFLDTFYFLPRTEPTSSSSSKSAPPTESEESGEFEGEAMYLEVSLWRWCD